MRQLRKRVVLVHELWQLGRTKEFFNCCSYWADVDDLLWCQDIVILYRHPFANVSFHPWKSKTHLVGKQFTNGTNPTVSKVVDIIHAANTFCKVQEIAHFCQDVSWSHNPYFVRWVSISDDGDNTVWICRSDNFEFLQFYWLCQNSSIIWNVGDFVQTVIQLFWDAVDHIARHDSTSFYKDFPCFSIYQWFCDCLVQQAILDIEFLVDLVATNWCQVITTWIKETSYQQATWAFRCFWFTRTKTLVDFFEGFICPWIHWIFVDIFFNGIANQFAVPKDIDDFIISRESKSTHKGCKWNFTRAVDTCVSNVFWVGFKL